ncbi:hypothetical protein ACFQ4C_17710 [Larkinella insperata]|uniref:Uncharacterized protein n=1 Tax=Larkinella insperata TaxID=332158 RepID=A0ABW3Q6Y3_9BACT|nr:hypothetical protein [Larkinella insperata]
MNRVLNYLILFALTCPLYGQSALTGLGPFVLGVTTPDSLHPYDFQEQELVVVKGTLALPCTGIRILRARSIEMQGVPIANVHLVFYENRLFRITCDYGEPLQNAFMRQHGIGHSNINDSIVLCHEGRESKRQVLKSTRWERGSIRALAIHATGYNDRCQPEQVSRLTIASLPVAAITSECDLDHLDPYLDRIWQKH